MAIKKKVCQKSQIDVITSLRGGTTKQSGDLQLPRIASLRSQ
jgi:hypothetical protein